MAIFALLVALLFSLAYTSWLRNQLVPEEFSLIPAESNIVVASGDISALWDGIEYHFGRVIQETDHQSEVIGISNQKPPPIPLDEEAFMVPSQETQQDEPKALVLEEIVVTGSEESIFDVSYQRGFLTEGIQQLRYSLEEQGIRIDNKYDLQNGYGIDVSRGMLAGYSPEMTSGPEGDVVDTQAFTLLIPMVNEVLPDKPDTLSLELDSPAEDLEGDNRSPREKLTALLSGLSGLDILVLPCGNSLGVAEGAVGLGEEFVLSFPRNDIAMLSSSCEQFSSSILNQDRNLKHARQDDWLFEAAHRQLRRPLLTGSGLLAVLRGLTVDFAPALRMAITINFTPDALLANLHLETENIQAKLVRNLLKSAVPGHEWRHLLDSDTGAVLLNKDGAIPDYLELASYDGESQVFLTEMYGGILDRIRQFEQTDQILLAAENFQDEIPLLLLGIWGPRSELEQQMLEMQEHLRRARDLAVLDEAASIWSVDTGLEIYSVEDLINSQYLSSDSRCGGEDLDWLAKYSYQEEGFIQLGPYPPGAFYGPDYEYSYRQHPVHFLDSCVTVNDLKFRLGTRSEDVVPGDLSALIDEMSVVLLTQSDLPESWLEELTGELSNADYYIQSGGGMQRIMAVESLENVIEILERPAVLPSELAALWVDSILGINQQLSSVSPAEETLMENRYRLAATLLDDSLWIASTANQIESLIDRSLDNQRTPGFEFGSTIQANKLHLILHISSLIEHSLLSGDSELEEFTTRVLLDFRYHSELNLSLKPIRWGRSLELGVNVVGPTAVLSP